MWRIFPSFLLWLMILTLPIQGIASASMLYCGMVTGGHHLHALSADGSSDHQGDFDVAHVHGIASGSFPDNDLIGQDAASHAGSADRVGDTFTKVSHANHKCRSCASCCGLTAITVTPQTHRVPAYAAWQYLEPLPLSYAVPSQLPKKPPRA
jgi:hypothetical protein